MRYDEEEPWEDVLCIVGGRDIGTGIIEAIGVNLGENNATHGDEEDPIEVSEKKNRVDSKKTAIM